MVRERDSIDRNKPPLSLRIPLEPIARSLDWFWWLITTVFVVKEAVWVGIGVKLARWMMPLAMDRSLVTLATWDMLYGVCLFAVLYIMQVLVSIAARIIIGGRRIPLPGRDSTAAMCITAALCRNRRLGRNEIHAVLGEIANSMVENLGHAQVARDIPRFIREARYLTQLIIILS